MEPAAKEAYENALRLEENNEEALYNLALLLRDSNPDLALDYLQRCISIDPDYARAHAEVGLLLWRRGEFEEAATYLNKSLFLNPHNPWTLLYCALNSKALGSEADYAMYLGRAHHAEPANELITRNWNELTGQRCT